LPHLTVAHGGRLEHSRVETELLISLCAGIGSSCSEVVLIENASGRWQQMQVFPLSFAAHASTSGTLHEHGAA
jgi:hypothetical protein